MPNFANPFQGNVERKMNNAELMQALRLDIAGELEAIYLYDSHYQATDDPAARAVLADIRDEEKAHMGELITLMRYLDPREAKLFFEGEEEVKEMLEDLKISQDGKIDDILDKAKAEQEEESEAEVAPPTVGSLIEK